MNTDWVLPHHSSSGERRIRSDPEELGQQGSLPANLGIKLHHSYRLEAIATRVEAFTELLLVWHCWGRPSPDRAKSRHILPYMECLGTAFQAIDHEIS